MSKPKFAPCPFCGGMAEGEIVDAGEFRFRAAVVCQNCGAGLHVDDKAETALTKAAELWNRRQGFCGALEEGKATETLAIGAKIYSVYLGSMEAHSVMNDRARIYEDNMRLKHTFKLIEI